eukprot:4703179-Pyramimonas_sp.AAC.1
MRQLLGQALEVGLGGGDRPAEPLGRGQHPAIRRQGIAVEGARPDRCEDGRARPVQRLDGQPGLARQLGVLHSDANQRPAHVDDGVAPVLQLAIRLALHDLVDL